MTYTVERTDDEIIIRFPLSTTDEAIKRQLDHLRYVELISKSKATQEDVEQLTEKTKQSYWDKNKHLVDRLSKGREE